MSQNFSIYWVMPQEQAMIDFSLLTGALDRAISLRWFIHTLQGSGCSTTISVIQMFQTMDSGSLYFNLLTYFFMVSQLRQNLSFIVKRSGLLPLRQVRILLNSAYLSLNQQVIRLKMQLQKVWSRKRMAVTVLNMLSSLLMNLLLPWFGGAKDCRLQQSITASLNSSRNLWVLSITQSSCLAPQEGSLYIFQKVSMNVFLIRPKTQLMSFRCRSKIDENLMKMSSQTQASFEMLFQVGIISPTVTFDMLLRVLCIYFEDLWLDFYLDLLSLLLQKFVTFKPLYKVLRPLLMLDFIVGSSVALEPKLNEMITDFFKFFLNLSTSS